MKSVALALAAVALAASLSQASAEPRNPATARVPVAAAIDGAVAAPVVVEGRQAVAALSAAEKLIIDRNVAHR